MVRACVGDRIEAGVSAAEILRGGRLLPRYWQLLVRLLNACVEDGYYRRDGDLFGAARPVPHEARARLTEELRGYCEGLDVIADTVTSAGTQLHAMMRGAVEPVGVIFPASASQGVEVLYQDFSFGRYFNQIAAGVVAGLARDHREPHFDVLEVGGGTGGTTAWLLPELTHRPGVRYDFTDISPIFTRRAADKFAAYDFVAYREFDLQRDAQDQGFAPAGYDLIVAANVIHATQHVGRTLRALRGLLKPGGHLVMREITRPMRLFDFVFGPLVAPLLDLPDRGGELFLDTARWEAACRGAGFSTVAWLPDDGTATARISEHVIVAGTAAPSGRVGRVGRDSGHPVLGRVVGSGAYLADWSDDLDDAAWQDRLRQAAEELTRRHGAGAGVPAWPAKLERPPGSGEVRLTWRPGLFGKAHIDIETAHAGDWQLVARAGPTARFATAPLPTPAPGTTYRWRWRPVATSRSTTAWRPVGADPETQRAWGAAGIVLDAGADARLIVPFGNNLAERATDVLHALGLSPRRAVVLTRGAWHAGSAVDPAQRALWGLLRVAGTEHPGAEIGAIDLAVDADTSDLAVGLAAIEAGERWVAVRDGVAQAQELAVDPSAQPGMPPDSLHTVRWHVVTGGFGGLGRASVAWLVRLGAERVAILAPRADEGARAWRADLERAAGATIRWLACDVASPDDLGLALRTLEAEGGIAGILHAAGTLDDAPLADLSVPRIERVLSVKADAAEILVAHLERERREGYLVLYSSAAAALGARGQGAHALASAHLDGLAERARTSGLAVVSVAWGAWGEIGRASTPALRQRLAAEGMGVLTTGEGLWHLEQALLGAPAYRLAMRVDLPESDGRRRLLAQTPRPQAAPPDPDRATPVARAESPAQPHAPDLTGDGETDAPVLRDWLARRIRAQLRLDAFVAIDADQDLLRLGLDSLLFLELSAEVERALGVRLNAARAYEAMTVAGLTALILSERAPSETPSRVEPAEPAAMASTDARARFEPFPLTPIQHAYWLGRTDVIDFGGIACHVVFEWDKTVADCDPDALERAWNAVVRRHDMLRATIGEDGFQSVAAQVPDYQFTRSDLRGLPPAEAEDRLGATRERLSRDVTPAERWPLFEVVISRRDEARYRLHMKLDLLLFDVQSFKVLFDDLATAYSGQALAPLDFTFRDYVLHQLAARERQPWRAAWRYWLDRIETLPPAPQLALAEGGPASRPRVTTRQGRVPEPVWTRLKAGWQAWGVTPSAALLTLFAIVLERACRRPDFTLNLTFFNRRPVHPDVPQLIGDFTSVLLVEFEPGSGEGLRERMEATQARLWRHLANSDVNGVDVLRELGRRHGVAGRPLMPVVFTSMLGMTLDGMSIDRAMTRLLGEPVCVLTQTPQVWIDHQVMEEDGGLLFHWYCMDAVLAPGLADALFRDYERLLDALASESDSVGLPAILPARRAHPEAAGPGLDWRDLEAVLGTYPGIKGALIEARADGPAVAWLRIDPHHDAPARLHSIDVDTASLPVLDAGQRAEVEAVWQALEARALHGIWATLQRHGLFAAEGQRSTHREVCERVGATATTERLLRQWLDHLCTRRLLRREDKSYVRTDTPRPERSAFPNDGPDWGRALFRFTDRSIEAHDALMRGERSALEIFFDAEAGGEQALYRAHPVPDCLSRAAAEILRQLAHGRSGLTVLEVGAGTGATTRAVLPAIRGALARYVFTDVSTLFLDDARKLFPDEPALRLAILDINAAPDFAAHPEVGYDIVLAVNVLHDATDVVRSLRRLRGLLSPDGVLLVVEATERDSTFQLATVGFIEGLNAFDDFRVEDGKAMLDVGQWRRVLDESGYALHLTWPPQAQGDWRQTLFVATPRASARPSLAGLADHLRAIWTGPLPALDPRLCEHLPRPSAGRPASERPTVAPDLPAGLRRADVERVVSEVWSGLLSRPIDATSDFFASGGDSLVATRMIAMLKGRGFPQAGLRHAFEHPRLAEFCAAIAAAEPERNDRLRTLSTGGDPVEVYAFHGSDGGVDPYLSLARALDCTVHGLAAEPSVSAPSLALLARRYVAAIRRRRPKGPYHLLGWSYGAFLAAEAAAALHADGQTVRLVLLDPVSRADFRYEDRAGLLRLLCEGRTRVALPADFDSLPAQSQFDVFLERAKSAGAWPELPDLADTEVAIARIDALLGLLGTASSAAVRVPCLWLSAVRRPAHWRPAAEEWGERLPFATRQDIDADHWQLVLDRETCARVAERWQRWRFEQRESDT
ncbi:SDR family NAD(P)-dependent oxidoreductase [Methylobacterium tarhaniae]|uniref:SDR family NAD(P)-dependent oxidoreductase n=1 Tax=Methylobacterium tarhaniae TaxID=1187852 RepID=UPI003159FF7C